LIRYVVQHHPARAELLRTFEDLNAIVIADPEPHAKLKIPWRTYHACMTLSLPGATWRVVIQDDAELCPNFREACENALQHADRPVCLFVPKTLRHGSVRLLQACNRDLAWCDLDWSEWVPVVAIAWPESYVSQFLEWAEFRRFTPDKNRADDAIVGRFAREKRISFLATVPSLVNHPDVEPSIIRNHIPKGGRRATCFAGDGALEIDWSRR
jgi:hypothetical protein